MNLRVGTELKVDLLGAIHMMTSAWNGVKKETVANCFRKAGFVTAELSEACKGGDDDVECMGDTFRELSFLFPAAVPAGVSADDFVNADTNVQAVSSLGDEDIVAAVAGTQADSSRGEDRPDEEAATRSYSAGTVWTTTRTHYPALHDCLKDYRLCAWVTSGVNANGQARY
ncbi:hypothetical protein HPB48_017225 [Haemaphysalis longicornis]|uniref:Uncharacterized protein n=1 Tax=Haemaphysalis longicornis TaxID=44386 RepID=A0A9J6GGY4_HAELO|nr:hypothetical protein HPB48_017225 [Haemaphysalis longicornis]